MERDAFDHQVLTFEIVGFAGKVAGALDIREADFGRLIR